MSTENWVPLTKEQVEKKFIEIINDYVRLELEYPLDPNMSLKDVKMFGSKDLKDIDAETLELLKSDYELDSIDILELVIQIEEEFGCVIDDKEVATLLRWEDLVGYITDSQDPTKIKKK